MYWQLSTSFAFERSSGQWTRGTENWASAFSKFYHHQFSDSVTVSFWFAITNRMPLLFWSNPRYDLPPGENLLAWIETKLALDSHSCSLSWDPHEMSLNINMNMIGLLESSGWSLIFDMNYWTLLQICNVVNPVKIFHSNSIGSPSTESKILHCDEHLNHVSFSCLTIFDCGFWRSFQKHNTESENT